MFDYEKRIIGFLFVYYRKKKKLTIQKMISYKSEAVKVICADCRKMCKNREAVISHKTIERVNKGQVAKRECLYMDFSDKLGFKYELSKYFSNKLDLFAKELLVVIRNKNKEQLNSLKFRLEAFKTQVANLIYYSQMITIFEAVIDLEMTKKYCDNSLISLMEQIYGYLKLDYKKIFIFYFCSYYFSHREVDRLMYFFQEAKGLYPENVQIELNRRVYETNPYDLLRELIEYKKRELPDEIHYFYSHYIAFSYLNLDKLEDSIKYLDECIELAKKNNMSDVYLYQCYMRKGLVLYRLEDYQGTIDSFKHAYRHDINIMVMNLIIFFDCFKKLNMEQRATQFLSNNYFSKINNEMISTIFKYYRLKYISRASESDLEDYIIGLLKSFLRKDSVYEKIILEDLNEYIEKTHHYNKLHQFLMGNKKKK